MASLAPAATGILNVETQDFVLFWLKSFYDQALANAQTSDGLGHDPEQNARLGQILSMIGGA